MHEEINETMKVHGGVKRLVDGIKWICDGII